MIYNEFISNIRPFFIQRGMELIGGENSIEFYLHTAIQSILNYHDWSFKVRHENIQTEKIEENKYIYRVKFNIGKIIYVKNNTRDFYINEDFKLEKDKDGEYLLFKDDVGEITIEYNIRYIWEKLDNIGTKEMILPDDFIPALINKIYDISSPLTQTDSNVIPRYQVAERELSRLKEIDATQESGQISY